MAATVGSAGQDVDERVASGEAGVGEVGVVVERVELDDLHARSGRADDVGVDGVADIEDTVGREA